MIKVNVWQVGYMSNADWKESNRSGKPQNVKCLNAGYVELKQLEEDWPEDVWHLLNWDCWNYDDATGEAVKPAEVHSPLGHCNSDVIFRAEGSDTYMRAAHVGFEEYKSLDKAINSIIEDWSQWPFHKEILDLNN